ncbi:heterokaryon incompatibility protein-domain-containing protein [Thelonectria olida]|uniref:Heterokaryon incompatibility protein-domain-containing protein n=1 Tax=Thelonectria olida TaxID=1576542 RepID=A0A9P8W420_9HYPO|nr:heterokaryon incompatibility protein-domain-containing protein [Thelonectria olida]
MESTIDALCSTCAAIDLKSLIYGTNGGSYSGPKISLGTIESIIQRTETCRFCTIVLDALRERYKRTPPKHMSNVYFGSYPSSLASESLDEIEEHGIPLTWSDEPIECHIAPTFFCSQDLDASQDEEETQSSREDSRVIYRLRVTLTPSPWAVFSSTDAVTFQAIWESHDQTEPAEQASKKPSPVGSGREVGPLIELSTIRRWLHQCEKEHGDTCAHPAWAGGSNEQGQALRVIDVKERRVVDLPPQGRYVCLSYVWGHDEEALKVRWDRCLTTQNFSQLREANGLDTIAVPKTIHDAMSLTDNLEERYLWVDALCIIQDDVGDLDLQTSQMDLVFSGAVLTIVAACGEDSDTGIVGIEGRPRNVFHRRIRISPDGLCLATTAALSDQEMLPSSTWNTRGWTYQEKLLSKRALVFTSSQVYWLCETSMWDEETILEPTEPPVWVLPQALGCNDEWDDGDPKFSRLAFGTYTAQYNTRQFTFPEDALSAFLGIIRRCERLNKEAIHWGLLTDRFDQALLWQHGEHRRERMVQVVFEGSLVHHIPYPSWTWLGWTGFVGGNIHNEALADKTRCGDSKSELVFYSLMSDGTVRPVGATATKADTTPTWKGDTSITQPIQSMGHVVSQVKSIDISGTGQTALPVHDTGRLVFWTSHAQAPGWLKDHGGDTLCVEIGDTVLTIESRFATDVFMSMAPPYKKVSKFSTPKKHTLEFIVISRFYEITMAEETGKLNVLVVKESEIEKGVWSRLGTAVIKEEDWLRLDRDWKMVILK